MDDTPANLDVVVKSLEGEGILVVVAQDGEEGLQRAEFAQPDLILLDVMMPGMDGFETCRRLKARASTRDISVIFMSALGDTEYKLAGFAAGGVDYLTKPLRIEEVMVRVRTHLKLHAMQRRLTEQNLQLQHYRDRLELQVAERTAALSESNRRLRERAQHYRDIFDNTLDGIALLEVIDKQRFRIMAINPSLEKLGRVRGVEVAGKYIEDFFPKAAGARLAALCRRCVELGTGIDHDVKSDWPSGAVIHHMTLIPVRDEHGCIHRIAAIARDFTRQKQLEEELQKRELEFRELVENSPDTIGRYDGHCRRIYGNPKLLANLGGDPAQILGKTPAEYPGGASAQIYQQKLQEVLACGEERDIELRWQVDGNEMCSHIRMTPELDASGQVTHVLAVGRNITEIDQYRKKIHRQAFFDTLTGLPNRALLSDHIRKEIAEAALHRRRFGLMMLDLDHFKEVNDTLGHGVGDQLLCKVAERLKDCVRSYDTVARLGGDEFAILLPGVREDSDVAIVACKIVDAFERPFHLAGKELFNSVSIGVALYPGDSTDIDALFKYADSAMYHAKKQGRDNFQFYSREMTIRASERMTLEHALRKAVKNGELELHYQPQVDLASGDMAGAEALLRWHRPGHGELTPDKFIPIAEETGLIVDIGEWVQVSACKAAVAFNQSAAVPFKVAINLSTRQFVRNDLYASVCRILAETGCKAEWLKLEITESLLLEDSDRVRSMLNAFNDMGVVIAIDDFGTGYSALSYLNRFPVSQIKIDRSFVRDMPGERDKAELVKAMISISQALRLELVAEGVETMQQANFLLGHGCRMAQGYLFGKPMPYVEFENLLATARRRNVVA